MNFNSFSKEVYESNKLRGFDESKESVGQSLMLIVSELSEALEADRNGRFANMEFFNIHFKEQGCKHAFDTYIKDSFEDEIADTFIRLFSFCGAFNIDIETHIKLKLDYNSKRSYKHGKRY